MVTTAPRGAGAVVVGAEAPTTDARPEAAQVVAVAPHNLTTREQIDRWVSARTPESVPFAQTTGPVDDRQMHGFVSGSIGTQDYSSVSVGVSLPIGENGRLDLAYTQTKNGYGYPGYGYGYGYPGYGYGYPGEFGYRPGDYRLWGKAVGGSGPVLRRAGPVAVHVGELQLGQGQRPARTRTGADRRGLRASSLASARDAVARCLSLETKKARSRDRALSFRNGAAGGNRTHDLSLTKDALYH